MIKLSKEVYAKVTEISKRLSMPRTQVINMLVTQWLKDNQND